MNQAKTSTIALSLAAALGLTLLALPAAHADSYSDAPEFKTPSVSALSRAEVQADLALWRRAGLQTLGNQEGGDASRPDIAERVAQYKQWRNGAEYRAELARLRGESTTTAQAEAVQKAR
jgi:hypothetical protein